MLEYWNSLDLLQQVFMLIAVPATLVLLIQTILLFFGHGGGDADLDSDVSGLDGYDGDIHGDMDAGDFHDHMGHDGAGFDQAGLRLFSVRGIFAFFAVAGWTGALCLQAGLNDALAILVALALGSASLYGLAKLMQSMMKLQESGNIDYRKGIGKTAQVYMAIPANSEGQGKINLILSGALGEYTAKTFDKAPLATGSFVRVIDVVGDVFVVEKE